MDKNIIMVIARYNEKLEWLKEEPFNKYKAIVYNKGPNTNFETHNVIKIIQLKNVGRENHTYFYHIITNYNKLHDITLFFPGSINVPHKKDKAVKLIKSIESEKNTVFIVDLYCYNLKFFGYNTRIQEYKTTTKDNQKINDKSLVTPAKINPYGKWLENKFPNNKRHKYLTFHCILGLSKKDILKNSVKYYLKYYRELNKSINPEEGFYVESTWSNILNIDKPIIKYPGIKYYYNYLKFSIKTHYKNTIKIILIITCIIIFILYIIIKKII